MLSLPDKFKSSYGSKVGSAFPIILIFNERANERHYFAQRTHKIHIPDLFNNKNEQYINEDRNLKVSSIKESINVFDKNFKTNKISISLSNYNNKSSKNFTETLNTDDFTGWEVYVFYGNEACERIADCLFVFKGYIRDYTINNEIVKFTVEDFSDIYLKDKSLPKNTTQNPSLETEDGNKNLHYSLVYGENKHSKLLFSRPEINSLITKMYPDYVIGPDSNIKIYGFVDEEKPLKILKDDMFLDVPKNFQEFPEEFIVNGYDYHNYVGLEQYKIVNDTIVVEKQVSDSTFTLSMPLTITSRDQFQVESVRKPTGVFAPVSDGALIYGVESGTLGDTKQNITFNEQYGTITSDIDADTIMFPSLNDSGQTRLGYYQDMMIDRIYARDDKVNWQATVPYEFKPDTGDWWLTNDYLQYYNLGGDFDDYTSSGHQIQGAVDMPKSLDYSNASSILDYLNLPPGYTTASWLYHLEEEKGWAVEEDIEAVYPKYGPLGTGLGNPSRVAGENNELLYANFDTLHPGTYWSRPAEMRQQGPYPWLRFYKTTGVEITGGGDPIRILFDNPINETYEYDLMLDHYAETGASGYPGLPDEVLNTVPLDTLWIDANGNSHSYIIPGSMDWLAKTDTAPAGYDHTPTLRKLLWGERIREADSEEHNIPLGSWVNGILPVLGYVKPFECFLTSAGGKGGSGWDRYYKMRADVMYAYGNPFWHGTSDGVFTTDLSQNIVTYAGMPSSDFPGINELHVIPIETSTSWSASIAFKPGIHRKYGSDFGPIFSGLNNRYSPVHFKNIFNPVSFLGLHAVIGGNYAQLQYSSFSGSEMMRAAKIDVTFSSVGGNDVVLGSTYARLAGNIKTEFYKDATDSIYTSNNDDHNLHFLVECDAFKYGSDGESNNVIKLEKINTLDDATYDEDTGLYSPIYKLQTGVSPADETQPEDSYIYSGSLAVGTHPEDPSKFLHEPDIFTEDYTSNVSPPLPEDNQWRQNINSVNNVSFIYTISPEITSGDIDAEGKVVSGFVGSESRGGMKTWLHGLELHQRFIVGNVSQLQYYGHVKGRMDEILPAPVSPPPGTIGDDNLLYVKGKYTGTIVDENSFDSEDLLITSPPDVFRHILEKELGVPLSDAYGDKNLDSDSMLEARENHLGWNFNFSISESTNPNDFIKDFCKSTLFVPKISPDGNLRFINIGGNPSQSDITINSKDVIKFNYKKTPKEDIYLKVRVLYNYKEGLDKYTDSTNKNNGGAVPLNYLDYLSLYRVNNLQDAYLEIESRYINDLDTARYLRNFYLEWYKNRHNIIECTLPHSYLHLECGDICQFDSLIEGVTIFGKDYTNIYSLNGQDILPYFLIEEVNKSTSGVSIRAIQLHKINITNPPIEEEDPTIYAPDFLWDIDDILSDEELEEGPELEYPADSLGTCQINIMSPVENGQDTLFYTETVTGITAAGCEMIEEMDAPLGYDIDPPLYVDTMWTADDYTGELGDVNFDSAVDLLDIVLVLLMILSGGGNVSADVNQDMQVDIIDVLLLVNMLTGEG